MESLTIQQISDNMKQSDLDAMIKGLPDAGSYPYDIYVCHTPFDSDTIIKKLPDAGSVYPTPSYVGEIVFEKRSIIITPFGKFVIWMLKGI